MTLKAYLDQKRAAGPERLKKRSKPRSPSHSILEKRRWAVFSVLIRRRDIKTRGTCFFCGTGPIQAAGHLISRQRLATRYHFDNVFGVCNSCNFKDRFQEGYHDHCVSVFIKAFGLEKYEELVALSRVTLDESKMDIIEMTKKFSEMLNAG